jgi:Ni,Fe-hydrogenase III large subunit/Ni,Fe-hydrogenase III component G
MTATRGTGVTGRVPDEVTAGELAGRAEELLAAGYRLALIAGHDDGDTLRVIYLFLRPGADHGVELQLTLDPADPTIPSLSTLSFTAGRFEREMRDLLGIVPQDHVLPSRMVRHFHWPRGWYPMRRGAGEPPPFGDVDGPFSFRTVEGAGVYEIPVGPVHAGMIGPGHFRFSVVGETVLNMKARLWFVHRGIEKLFEGADCADGARLAERVSGDTSVGHAVAFCRAVEDALGMPIPAAAQQIRAVLLELERLYNHIGDIGALSNDAGHSVLNSQALRVREQLLRINDAVTGGRLLRGAVTVGGATVRGLPDPAVLRAIADDVTEIAELATSHSVVRDRFAGTAVLSTQDAHNLGTLGYVARASGVPTDARYDHPVPDVRYPPPPAIPTDGDVLARFLIRVAEFHHSVATIGGLVDQLSSDGAARGGLPSSDMVVEAAGQTTTGRRAGVGIAEGWRGTIVHRVELDGAGRLSRVKIVDPSFFNWPALPIAMQDTIVPDFPLANKSFNLSYAGNDL